MAPHEIMQVEKVLGVGNAVQMSGIPYDYRMQTSEREGCGIEVELPAPSPEATLESLPAATKSPAFDLFQLGSVLQEAGGLPGTPEGCRRWGSGILLRYRFAQRYSSLLGLFAFLLLGRQNFLLHWPLRQWLGCPFCPGEE